MTLFAKKLYGFIALCLFVSKVFSQQQLCANAHNLIDVQPISVPTVSWSPTVHGVQLGCFQDSLHQPYWLKFTALTSGTFEFALTPKNLSADYDFILFKESCPCDTNTANIVACNWLGWVNQLFGATGISSNPYNLGVKDTLAWAEFEKTVFLQAGTNYYLLVDNITNNGVGFDMQFSGSAKIGKALPDPIPTITSIDGKLSLCQGEEAEFEVKSNLSFSQYEWIIPNDAKLTGNGNKVKIRWGKGNGEIKVFASTTCHKDTFSINIVGKSSPELAYLGIDYFCKKSCFDAKSMKINDLNNNPNLIINKYENGTSAWFDNGQNLIQDYICQTKTIYCRGTLSNGCFDTLQLKISEVENPSVVLLGGGVACPGDTAQLNFSFTGKAPFNVSYTDGQNINSFSTNSNIYSIKVIVNQDISYKITNFSEQSNVCQSRIIGEANFYTPANCVCLKRAGSMNPMPIETCANDIAKSSHNNDHQGGINDILAFILHSTPKPELGTVYATASNPEFLFSNGLMTNKLYYISSVLGAKKTNGTINLSDPCLGISAGIPVMFHSLPTAQLLGDSLICQGQKTDLLLKPNGIAPFQIDFSQNGQSQALTLLTDLILNQKTNGEYIINKITDANGCTASNIDTLRIQTPNKLTINNIKTTCNPDNSYFVSFDVNGGDKNSYFTIGKKGKFQGNKFTSEAIASGQVYFFQVKDANNCDSVMVSGSYKCDCIEKSNPGKMNDIPIVICASFAATASYQNDYKLAQNHLLGFVLQDSLGNILSYNANFPNFKFENGMKKNYAYFIKACAGFKDANGKIDFKSDCTTFSNATTITFVDEPSANFISNSTTLCKGDSLKLAIQLNGIAPFRIIYKENNISKTAQSNDNQIIIPQSILDKCQFELLEIYTEGTPGCKGTIGANNKIEINAADTLATQNLKINCSNDKKSFTVSFDISGGDGKYLVNGINLSSNKFTSILFSDASNYKFEVESQLGCKKLLVTGTGYCSCPPDASININIIVPIRCHDDKKGILEASTNLKAPYEFVWNTGQKGNTLSNLKSGTYQVTATNFEDCKVKAEIVLDNPKAINSDIVISSLKCVDDNNGEIIFENVNGGTPPYQYSINNRDFISEPIFSMLKPLTYEAVVKDSKGCVWEKDVVIEEPEDFYIELGDDISIDLGETVQLRAFSNSTPTSLKWNIPTFTKEIETFQPLKSTKIEVEAINSTGCKVKDAVWVYVNKARKVYVPTAFSPNEDYINDSFTIYAGNDVAKITNFKVFDRWGTLVYQIDDLKPNDETMGWQGTYRNYIANEGSYLYSAEIHFIDGKKEVINGDVLLKRN